MTIKTELLFGYEGYAPAFNKDFDRMTFYGYAPVPNHFSIVYKQIQQESGSESTFSFWVSKEDAVSLKGVLEDEKKDRGMRSNTYDRNNVFMTCMMGYLPVISFADRGFSFRFLYDEDYDRLLDLLETHLK